jgi:23S rRNA (guanosine2251-2'-O)-methyltransferase
MAVNMDDLIYDDNRLEGRNPCLEALKAGRPINKLFVLKGEREGSIKQIVAIAKERGIVIQEVDRQALDRMAITRAHQGVIALVAAKEYVDVDDILKVAEDKGEPPFIIILDEITDPQNFGSILRTAESVGVHGVIIPKRRSVSLDGVVAKASAGAVEYIPVARVSNLSNTIEHLKKKGIWIIGTEMDSGTVFYKTDLRGPVALVIGSEGAGIGRLIKENCDIMVNIPMKGVISSLNASVASAVVLYEIYKQRIS